MLLSMIPAVAGLTYGAFNKPKKSDFMPSEQLEAYQNMITERQNEVEGKSLFHSLMKPAIRQSAINRERSKRDISESLSRGNMTEGQAVQAGLSSDTQINAGVTDQMDKAITQQSIQNQENTRLIDKARLEIGNLKDQASRQFKTATQDWWGQMAQNATGVLSAGIGGIMDKTKSAGLQNAVNSITSQKGTPAYFRELSAILGLAELGLELPGGNN